MIYTEAHQRADTNFLIGARYGRDAERARLLAVLAEIVREEQDHREYSDAAWNACERILDQMGTL